MLLIYAFMLVLNQVFSDIFLGYIMQVYTCIWFVFTDSYWTWNIFRWFTCQEWWFSIGNVKLPEGIGVSLRLTLKIWNHLKSHGLSSSKLKLTWIGPVQHLETDSNMSSQRNVPSNHHEVTRSGLAVWMMSFFVQGGAAERLAELVYDSNFTMVSGWWFGTWILFFHTLTIHVNDICYHGNVCSSWLRSPC